eukprot:12743991-Heterocapsa_arctica.AAC.1
MEASKPHQNHLGRMGQALIEGQAHMDQSAQELLARNGFVEESEGFKTCLEMMQSFRAMTQIQFNM